MNFVRYLYSLWLRWCIREAESYIRACREDGLVDSLSIREWWRQIDADRVRLIQLSNRRHAGA